MVDVAHSAMTGVDLHIIKGADTATAGQVPIADGLGDAPFGTPATASAFGTNFLHIQETASGAGPTLTNAMRRPLNSVLINNITAASLVANQITLPAGTYQVDISSSIYGAGQFALYLYNITTSADIVRGRPVTITAGVLNGAGTYVASMGINTNGTVASITNGSLSLTAPVVTVDLVLKNRFTLASVSVLELRINASASVSGGQAYGGANIYTDAQFWKVS